MCPQNACCSSAPAYDKCEHNFHIIYYNSIGSSICFFDILYWNSILLPSYQDLGSIFHETLIASVMDSQNFGIVFGLPFKDWLYWSWWFGSPDLLFLLFLYWLSATFYLGLQTRCWSFDRAIFHSVCSYWRKIWQFGFCKATDTCGC